MYFCPCSCSKADCENEEDVLICLPRNLSYAGESYLERYSVSSAFVHNGRLEKQLLQADVEEHYRKVGAAACEEVRKELGEEGGGGAEEESGEPLLGARAMAHHPLHPAGDTVFRGGPDHCDVTRLGEDTTPSMALPSPTPDLALASPSLLPQLTVTIDRQQSASDRPSELAGYVVKSVTESPDSDLVSEEGIFVNLMDDLDGLGSGPGGKSTLSEASDDTCVSGDSMYYSPVEVEEMEEEEEEHRGVRGHDLRQSLEEAVQQAAFTFHPPTSLPLPQSLADVTTCPVDPSLTLSLPLPHANDGESESDGNGISSHTTDLQKNDANDHDVTTTHSTDHENNDVKDHDVTTTHSTDRESNDVSNPDVQPSDSVPGATSDNDSSSPVPSHQPKPAGLKTTGVFGIYLMDVSAAGKEGEEKGPRSSSYHDFLSPSSPLYEDREFNFTRTELRKSTSLKSTKTPPGTPRRKKVVRFADAMGLDLESVRHVLNLESPPKIPPSAMKDLQPGLSEDRKAMGSRFITETFSQPGADPRFRERVTAEKVVLENALVVSGAITGVVRVANVAFHKAVRVRFTTNGWASFHDIAASYMANSNDGPTDRFAFTLVPPPDFCPGARLEFAISYSANGTDYWDNNYGINYVFECYAKTVPTEAENAWMHFL